VKVTDEPLELSIVMPCLNEAATLERCVRKAHDFLRRHHVAGEVVVGDNGSTDGSGEIARRAGARVVPVAARGYGAAVQTAAIAAHGRFIIMGDADDSYDFSHLMPMLEQLRAGFDLVMGNRFAGGIAPGAMPWKNRFIGNPALSGVGRLLFGVPVHDFHCGLRGFSTKALERMNLQTDGMEYASEMVIKASLLGLRITEVPTTLRVDGRGRTPHLRPWRDGWRHLRLMLLFSPRWLFLYPGIVLMVLGSVIGLWLLPGPRVVGGIELDVHTLLYCAMAILIGFQATCFAVLANTYAIDQGLLGEDSRIWSASRRVTLELGLAVGAGLFAIGMASSVAALWNWREQSFGHLDPRQMLRAVIPSALALTLGCQVALSSFFLSILGLRSTSRTRAEAPAHQEVAQDT
jgi:glycosyltransferase involved in cell wall biosynthesis